MDEASRRGVLTIGLAGYGGGALAAGMAVMLALRAHPLGHHATAIGQIWADPPGLVV